MKNYIEKTLNNIKKINICEKVILAFFIVLIIFLPIGKLPVDVKITYEGSNELKEKNAIVYIDSGKNYNDDEGYLATIKNDKTCIAHIKNYIYPVSVRIDPIDDMTVLGISKIEVKILDTTIVKFQGENLWKTFKSVVNIESVYLQDNIVHIIPANDDPEIFMSSEFNIIFFIVMLLSNAFKLLFLFIVLFVFLLKIHDPDKWRWTTKQCRLIAGMQILGLFGSFLIYINSVNVIVTYGNNEELMYDVSMIYTDEGHGWNGSYEGNIRSDGKARINLIGNKNIDWVRIDPITSTRKVDICKVEISSLGRIYATYEKNDLLQIIDRTVNVKEIYCDGDAVSVIPTNGDAELLMGAEFTDQLILAIQKDEMLKQIILAMVIVLIFTVAYYIGDRLYQASWIRKRWMVCAGIGIAICTVYILFSDIISGSYVFSYTNIMYQIEPFRTLGVATKGLTGSDMADATFSEMVHLFAENGINNWHKYNVFGYSVVNETYLLSPFMWLCYGITSIGQLIRYVLKYILAIVGMYFLLRDMKCEKVASWIGGVTYAFSSAMVMWSGWQHTDVSCLAPFLFFFTNKFVDKYKNNEKKAIHFWLAITFVLYIMLIAGMPTYVIAFLYLGVIYELYNMIVLKKFSWKQVMICVVLISLAVLLAGLMSFAYTGNILLTTQDYRQYRTGAEEYAMYTADKSFLISFLVPQLMASGASGIECNVFSGIFVLFIIPAYLIASKKRENIFWGSTIVILLFFVFSNLSGYIFKYIPLLNATRKARILVLMNFSISVLSALLISQLMLKKVKKRHAIFTSIVCGGIIISYLIFVWYNKDKMNILQAYGMMIAAVIALLGMVTMICGNKKQFSAMSLLVAVSISGALFAKNSLQMIDADAQVIPEATDSIIYLQENASDEYRMATVGQSNFIPNLNSYYGINNLCGHAAVNTENKIIDYLTCIDSDIYDTTTKTSIKKIDNWNLLLYGGIRYLLVEEEDLNEIDMAGIRYNITKFDDGQYVIELLDTQPRAYIATNSESFNTQYEVLNAMMDSYKKNTIYSDNQLERNLNATEKKSFCSILKEDGNSILIDAKVDGNAYVVLSDYCNNDWKVYVNGEKQNLINCNYLFSAVYLKDAGNYTIELVYGNDQKNIYWIVTFIAWGIFLVILVAHKRIAEMFKCFQNKIVL